MLSVTRAGFCEDSPTALQHLLPSQPPAALVLAVHRGAPRPEVAPPSVAAWPSGITRHVFVDGVADGGGGWGVVAVDAVFAYGVEGWRHAAPVPVLELSGRARPMASAAPMTPSVAASLRAVVEALQHIGSVAHPGGHHVLLHVRDAAAACMAVGVWSPAGGRALVEQAQLEFRRLRRRGSVRLWVASGVAGADCVWRDRSRALALTAAGVYGNGDDADAECPVCFEDYADRLPGAQGVTRALPVFACGHWRHSMCRTCLAGLHIRRCPFCRADPA
jgi:hypothetical protein